MFGLGVSCGLKGGGRGQKNGQNVDQDRVSSLPPARRIQRLFLIMLHPIKHKRPFTWKRLSWEHHIAEAFNGWNYLPRYTSF